MRVFYQRVSSIQQNTDRQNVGAVNFDYLIEDKVSGSIPFFVRNGGIELLKLVDKGGITEIGVWETSRLGRDIRDIINTIHFFTEKGICINFVSQGLKTLNPDGSENPISKMVINILGVISEMERNQILERQYQGIQIAKAKGVYKGRKRGTQEDTLTFLSKPRNRKVIELLKKGYKIGEIQKITELSPNTISKIKKQLL